MVIAIVALAVIIDTGFAAHFLILKAVLVLALQQEP
jgi:hypothetical protein